MKKLVYIIFFIFLIVPAYAQVSNYRIFAQLNPQSYLISGYVEVDYYNNTSQELKEIYFYLPANLLKEKNPHINPVLQDPNYVGGFDPGYTEVKNVFDKDGIPLNYSYEKGKILFSNYSLEDNYLKVILPYPLLPGKSFTLKILFSTKFPRAYFGDNSFAKDSFVWRFGWFPQELYFSDGEWDKGGRLVSCNFSVELLVPKNYKVALGVDEQKEEITDDSWKKVVGINYGPRRSLPIAISPNYQVYKFPSQRDPEILVYFYPGREYKARILATYAREIMDKYISLYGPSGHKRVVIVEGQIEGYWGMTADGLIILGNSIFYSSDLFTPFLLERINEWLLAHEIAHLWWGIGVGADFDAENWLSEAFAQYSSIYYFEEKYGSKGGNLIPDLGDDYFLEYLKDNVLGEWNLRESQVELPYLLSVKDKWDEPIVKDYWNSIYNGYETKVYGKAYLLLRALAFEIGEEKFNNVLKLFFERYKGKLATTKDFESILEEVTHKDFSGFFNTWFYSTATIDWQVLDFSSYPTLDGWNTKIHIRREGEGILPVEILLVLENGEEVKDIYYGNEKDVNLNYQTKSKVVRVLLDPDSKIPDINRLNNSMPRKIIYTSKRVIPLDAYVIYYDLIPSFFIDLTTGQISYLSYHIEGYDPIDHKWSLESFYLQDKEETYQGTFFQFVRYLPRNDNFSFSLLWIYPNYFAGEASLTKNFWQKFDLGVSGNLWQPAYQLRLTLGYINYGYFDVNISKLNDYYSLAMQNDFHIRTSIPFQQENFIKVEWSLNKFFLVFPHSYLSVSNKLGYTSVNSPEDEIFDLSDWMSLKDKYTGNFKWTLKTTWSLPIIREQEMKILNLFIFRSLNFKVFSELGGVWNTQDKIDEKGLKLGLGFELSYNFTTFLDLPISLNIGYAFPVYQGLKNPNENGNYYLTIGVGEGF
ncbi:MAG: hypothetical protein CBR30_01345 [Dictyoglomus sp. NZ13-RE01]|nr:MAG: hypothetical protein CBR30_01345 [Dictyoglomus sp. NZ13-RE01]